MAAPPRHPDRTSPVQLLNARPQRLLALASGIVLVRGKGRRERLAPVGSFAAQAIGNWLRVRKVATKLATNPHRPLFVNKFGSRLTTRSVARMLDKHITEAGLDQRTSPHTLRHSFATHMLAGGAEIRALQELLGHASIATTQIYTHVEHTRLKTVHRKCHPRG